MTPDGTEEIGSRLFRELRAWQSYGHAGGCLCKQCDGLRQQLSGNLDAVESYPLRYGVLGDFCMHGIDVLQHCETCCERWLKGYHE